MPCCTWWDVRGEIPRLVRTAQWVLDCAGCTVSTALCSLLGILPRLSEGTVRSTELYGYSLCVIISDILMSHRNTASLITIEPFNLDELWEIIMLEVYLIFPHIIPGLLYLKTTIQLKCCLFNGYVSKQWSINRTW